MLDREMCRWDTVDGLGRGQAVQLWLDDVREPPPDGQYPWVWAKSAWQAKYLLSGQAAQGYVVVAVSLDHDLGPGQSGYDVACYLEREIRDGVMGIPEGLWCHSSNPVGRARILQAFESIGRIERAQSASCQDPR